MHMALQLVHRCSQNVLLDCSRSPPPQYLGSDTFAVMLQAQQLPRDMLKQTEQMQRLQQGMVTLLASATACKWVCAPPCFSL